MTASNIFKIYHIVQYCLIISSTNISSRAHHATSPHTLLRFFFSHNSRTTTFPTTGNNNSHGVLNDYSHGQLVSLRVENYAIIKTVDKKIMVLYVTNLLASEIIVWH